jgi:hypothetical protein
MMSRHLALLLTLVFVAGSLAAPQAKSPGQPTYYPTVVGTKWVYQEEGKRERACEVTEVEVKGEETLVTVEDTTNGHPYDSISISPKGLYRVRAFNIPLNDPYCVLRFPVKEGDTWKHENKPQRLLKVTARTFTVKAIEEVEVPAGKYKAVRVEHVITSSNGKALDPVDRFEEWYAPDVGVVKSTLNGETIRVLKSFTAGKK